MNFITFWTISILAPIPFIHFALHSFLTFWRRKPLAFYVTIAILWLLSFFAASFLVRHEKTFFTPPSWLIISALVLEFVSLLLIFWAIITIGPKRFFLFAIVFPKKVEQKYIKSGPYLFVRHPAYLGYLAIWLFSFLATGRVVLLFFFIFALICVPIIISLEDREMKERLG